MYYIHSVDSKRNIITLVDCDTVLFKIVTKDEFFDLCSEENMLLSDLDNPFKFWYRNEVYSCLSRSVLVDQSVEYAPYMFTDIDARLSSKTLAIRVADSGETWRKNKLKVSKNHLIIDGDGEMTTVWYDNYFYSIYGITRIYGIYLKGEDLYIDCFTNDLNVVSHRFDGKDFDESGLIIVAEHMKKSRLVRNMVL